MICIQSCWFLLLPRSSIVTIPQGQITYPPPFTCVPINHHNKTISSIHISLLLPCLLPSIKVFCCSELSQSLLDSISVLSQLLVFPCDPQFSLHNLEHNAFLDPYIWTILLQTTFVYCIIHLSISIPLSINNNIFSIMICRLIKGHNQ